MVCNSWILKFWLTFFAFWPQYISNVDYSLGCCWYPWLMTVNWQWSICNWLTYFWYFSACSLHPSLTFVCNFDCYFVNEHTSPFACCGPTTYSMCPRLHLLWDTVLFWEEEELLYFFQEEHFTMLQELISDIKLAWMGSLIWNLFIDLCFRFVISSYAMLVYLDAQNFHKICIATYVTSVIRLICCNFVQCQFSILPLMIVILSNEACHL